MKKWIVLAVLAVGVLLVVNLVVLLGRGQSAPTTPSTAPDGPRVVAAGPGRVEPISEEISVSAQVSGRLREVFIDEGDHIERGQLLAVVENRDYLARVRSTEAELLLKRAQLRRLVNGAREQERREIAALLAEAEIVLEHARVELTRQSNLFKDGVVSRREAEAAEREARVSEARVEAARERYRLLEAGAREEDRDGAESEVALTRARLEEVRALYEKTLVRAPISGVILHKHRKVGESVSTQFDTPIVTIADRSALRVRVDVDEADVSKIAIGQQAYVTADAFEGKKFWGRIVQVGQVLGRKNIRTDEPVERVDTKILEVLVQLDDGHELPLGLRVASFILDDADRVD
jgi:ABC exporter DevB family membrane fusion protein